MITDVSKETTFAISEHKYVQLGFGQVIKERAVKVRRSRIFRNVDNHCETRRHPETPTELQTLGLSWTVRKAEHCKSGRLKQQQQQQNKHSLCVLPLQQ
jgi:hypothetical protein